MYDLKKTRTFVIHILYNIRGVSKESSCFKLHRWHCNNIFNIQNFTGQLVFRSEYFSDVE